MKLALRLALYVALLVLAGFAFSQFRGAYQKTAPTRLVELGEPERAAPTVPELNASTSTNAVSLTNAVTDGDTNAVAATETATPPAEPSPTNAPGAKADRKSSSMIYLGAFLAAVLGLGALGAWDVAHLLGDRAGRSVMAEDYTEKKDPDYEAAEAEWAKGNHLDSIGLMRDYLKRNPSEQHAALRIAEIYEKDLGNYLAAALELEEVLQTKLPREKWGWTAIRLSNLYSGRLNQPSKALAVLDRIVQDYSETSAAKKARERLGLPEPTPEAPPEGEATEESASASTPELPAESPALPKGFRKKK
jgi:hypothetical protein